MLKADFAHASQLQIAKEMLAFFQEFSQGDSSPDSYEAALCDCLTSSPSLATLSACHSRSCSWFEACMRNMEKSSSVSGMVRRSLIRKTCSPLRLGVRLGTMTLSRKNTSLLRSDSILATSPLSWPVPQARSLERSTPCIQH